MRRRVQIDTFARNWASNFLKIQENRPGHPKAPQSSPIESVKWFYLEIILCIFLFEGVCLTHVILAPGACDHGGSEQRSVTRFRGHRGQIPGG